MASAMAIASATTAGQAIVMAILSAGEKLQVIQDIRRQRLKG